MMHIGVEIGGTFTDRVAVDRDGRRSIAKDALAMMRGAGRVAGLPIERVYRVRGSERPAPLVVATTYDKFTQGFHTADLRAARRLLSEL
jgi:N-methylhydantoinase A/oxoprolinase/acetone carboxylase beta subunit